jgi:hypothetical protein
MSIEKSPGGAGRNAIQGFLQQRFQSWWELQATGKRRPRVANEPQASWIRGQPSHPKLPTYSNNLYWPLLCSCLLGMPVELRTQATAHPQPGLQLLDVGPGKAEQSVLPIRDQLLLNIAARTGGVALKS